MQLRLAGLIAGFIVGACGGPGDTGKPAAGADATAADGSENGSAMTSKVFDLPYLMRDLDNGLRVVIVRTDYPDIVSLQIPVQTGSRNEVEPGKSGFAHFFEHMMFRGTEKYPSEAYSALLKKAGASNNAYTTDDYTNYHITVTKPELEKMLELEADRFRNLAYSETDFRTEALAVKGEYLKDYSDPVLKAFERTRALSFRVHPYAHTTMGFIEDIEAMPEQLDYSKQFFDRFYRPENTSIIIVGDVDPEAAFDMVEKYWGSWKRGSFAADIPAEPAGTGPQIEHIRWEGETQPWLFIGFRSPAFVPGEKDYPAMAVLSSVYFSDSSPLYQKLVIEDQSVDQLLTDFPLNKDPNLNLIYLRLTDEKHAAGVEAAVLETLATARSELIAADRLAQTRSRLRYSFTAALDSSQSIGDMLASYVQCARTPETVNEIYAGIAALTAEDIRRFADRYFTDLTRVTVSLSTSPAIAGLGTVSLDEMAKARGLAAAPRAWPGGTDEVREEALAARGEAVPVSLVAQPSATSPLIDVAFLVHAGAAMDPPGKKGLAALTAAMVTEGGSATWSIKEINEAMYPIASGFEAQVDKEMTRLSGQVHKDNLDGWYRYVRSQLLNPGWREADFARLKTQLANDVRTDLVADNDEELGKEVLYSSIYGPQHPYGSLSLGHSSDIAALTLDDTRDFYAKYYTVNNLTVGVAGGYPDSFLEDMSTDLQVLPAGKRTAPHIPAASPLQASRATIIAKETPGVAVSFGFPIELRRGDPDWIALWLVRSWLGEHRSENSHLYQRIREMRGMNYGDYAYVEYFPEGMYRTTPATNLGRQQQIFQVWIRPVRNNNDAHFATRAALFEMNKLISEGMSEAAFEATRTYLEKSVSLLTDGQTRQLEYALDSQYYGIDAFADYVRDGLSRLTLADVNRVIADNMRTDKVQYVFVTGDADDLAARLAQDERSPVSYDAEKPAELLREDQSIERLPLQLEEENIRVVPAAEIFR